jgi:hypothetical protein
MQRPFGTELGGQWGEADPERLEVECATRIVEVDPLVEPGIGDRLALLGAEDVPALLGDVG